MPRVPQEIQDLSPTQKLEVESRIARFELLWHSEQNPDLNDFLPDDPAIRELVHAELLAIENEFRSRASQKSCDTVPLSKTSVPIRMTSSFDGPTQRFSGGLGDVWVVHEPSLGRTVVIKQLQLRWRSHQRAREAFLQEVLITSLLEHPGVAPVHAVGETVDGRPCYSMRYIQGETFEEAIRKYHQRDQRLFPELRKLLNHFVTVCNTVAYAHSRGILHRDLKPANIMIGAFGQTMVIDWGLAKHFSSVHSPKPSTETAERFSDTSTKMTTPLDGEFSRMQSAIGDIVGTPAFMSAEQAAGQVDKITIQTDVFGLGAILFMLLHGNPPYESSSAEQSLDRAARRDVQFPSQQTSVPNALAAICAKAMSQLPAQRYCDAVALASDVQNWLAGEPIMAMRQPLAERLVRFARHRRTLAITAIFSCVALLLTAGVAMVSVQQERHERLLAARTADIKAKTAKDISDYFSKVFRTIDPARFDDPGFVGSENSDAGQTLRKILDRGFELIENHLSEQPELHAQMLTSMGNSYRGLSDFGRAESLLKESLLIRQRLLGDSAAETIETKYHLARLDNDIGEYETAELAYRSIIDAAQKLDPPLPLFLADVQYHLAWLLFFQPLSIEPVHQDPEKVLESIRLFSKVIQTRERLLPANDRSLGLAYAGMAAAEVNLPERSESATISRDKAMTILKESGQETLLGSFMLDYRRAEELRYNDAESDEVEPLYIQLGERLVKYSGT